MADEPEASEPKPKKPAPREVWFACRATPKCEGKVAIIVHTRGKPGQGSVTRYRCKTCGRPWHVTV